MPPQWLYGLVIEKYNNRIFQFVAMVLGTAVCYALGTAWFCVIMDVGIAAALGMCVFPFIPGDIAKIVIAIIVGPVLRKRLHSAGFIG